MSGFLACFASVLYRAMLLHGKALRIWGLG